MFPRLLADLHISPKTVYDLLKNGYDISRVTDHIPPTSADQQIIINQDIRIY